MTDEEIIEIRDRHLPSQGEAFDTLAFGRAVAAAAKACPVVAGATAYAVDIQHDDDGDLTVTVKDVGSSSRDRSSVAWALREAARMVEDGMLIHKSRYS